MTRWPGIVGLAGVVLLGAAGCAHIHDQYTADSPSLRMPLHSPTAADVTERFAPAEGRHRDWEVAATAPHSPAVPHGPLYFEDPFEDKGTTYAYRLGWEDWVAMPYSYARFTLNWLALPVSAIVTPPWTPMESDGKLSMQALGQDHDATRAGSERAPTAPPAAEEPA